MVFVYNFNRAVWVYNRLKEVAERERERCGGKKSVGYNFGEADSLRFIANHLALNHLSNFAHHFAARNNCLHITSSLVCHLTASDSVCIFCFLVLPHFWPFSAHRRLQHFSRFSSCREASLNSSPSSFSLLVPQVSGLVK